MQPTEQSESNRLVHERSPYLLQHAYNPVDWYPWGEEAFAKARAEDKPIFLSIGYSTCHWCHVMERESFESHEIAEVLNRSFVSIKLDREERPDIDRIYMTFVQATTGGGGWPMSVWLTPELKPFYGGTYFPPENRYGRPGFRTILEHIASVWAGDRARVVESSKDVVRQLSEMISAKAPRARVDEQVVESCSAAFRRSFDTRNAGFGNAPKFPRPVQFQFLLRHYARSKNEDSLQMTLATLQEMYKGGMYDQLGGGFHRYSVDAHWFVPHFEKMLYDQAQLVSSYIEAFQITGEPFYAGVARETLDYVLRDMTDERGGFFSAEDADSVIDAAQPKHKGEGAFYIWTEREIDEIVRKPEADWFNYHYGVKPGGNVDEDPHGEFTGQNILYQAHTIAETAQNFGVTEEEVQRAIESASKRLMERRATRVRPHLDDKVLTAWNGLMISAFAKAAVALDEEKYLSAAVRAARFVLDEMWNAETGILLRRYRDGHAAIPGFLDDYAFFVQALLDLYEATFDASLLVQAEQILRKMLALFEDQEEGGFYSTAAGDASLVLRIKDDYDGAEPSGNSVALMDLLRVEELTNDESLRKIAERTLQTFAGRLTASAITLPLMVSAYMLQQARRKMIVIVGSPDAADTKQMLNEIRRRYLPFAATLLINGEESRETLARWLPLVRDMKSIDGRATAYVCENYGCQLPTAELNEFVKLLE